MLRREQQSMQEKKFLMIFGVQTLGMPLEIMGLRKAIQPGYMKSNLAFVLTWWVNTISLLAAGWVVVLTHPLVFSMMVALFLGGIVRVVLGWAWVRELLKLEPLDEESENNIPPWGTCWGFWNYVLPFQLRVSTIQAFIEAPLIALAGFILLTVGLDSLGGLYLFVAGIALMILGAERRRNEIKQEKGWDDMQNMARRMEHGNRQSASGPTAVAGPRPVAGSRKR